jgi:hypothetical protein
VNSGNFEFIGVRHREFQTLYLSPLVDVQRYRAFAKLHTGLYIAAFRDTVDRALQLRAATELPLSWTCSYYPNQDSDDGDLETLNQASISRDVSGPLSLPTSTEAL